MNKKNKENQFEKFFNDVKDDTKKFSKNEIENGKIMAILSYIIPFIPYLIEKDNQFVIYHAKQGMNIFIINLIYSLASSIINTFLTLMFKNVFMLVNFNSLFIFLPITLIGICISVFYIIGIVNVCNGQAKEIPIINKIQIIK